MEAEKNVLSGVSGQRFNGRLSYSERQSPKSTPSEHNSLSTSDWSRPEYASLLQKYRGQNPKSVFAEFPWDRMQGETWESPLQNLAALAKNEPWDFQHPEFKRPGRKYPVLFNYLNQTFLRLQSQLKIKYAANGTKACFNTGLQTPEGKDIFAVFLRCSKSDVIARPNWILSCFCEAYSGRLREFDPLPEIATYIEDPSDLVFDLRFSLEIDYRHILKDHSERLPPMLRDNLTLAQNAIEGAARTLKERLKRNYKLAVPNWRNNGIQLLLPLSITGGNEADIALAAEKDAARKTYLAWTILPMDIAYVNARLICAPDKQWLMP